MVQIYIMSDYTRRTSHLDPKYICALSIFLLCALLSEASSAQQGIPTKFKSRSPLSKTDSIKQESEPKPVESIADELLKSSAESLDSLDAIGSTAMGGSYDAARVPIKIPSEAVSGSRSGDAKASFAQPAPPISHPSSHFDSPANWGDMTGPILPPARWMTPSRTDSSQNTRRQQAAARSDDSPRTRVKSKPASAQTTRQESFTPRSGNQNLVVAVELARDGKVRQAEALATKVYQYNSTDTEFSILYMETMVTIAEFSKKKAGPLNKAIKVAAKIQSAKIANGKKDAELSFKFLKALRSLGESVTKVYPKVGAKLLIAEGDIASELMKNSDFPVEARPGLADSFFNHAWGLAIRSSGNDVTASLNRAFELGFQGYDRALLEPAFQRLETAGDVSFLVNMHRSKSVSKLSDWAQQELANFRPFDFKFLERDVSNGSRIAASDYRGQVLVVDFWATWCEPCRRQLPHLLRLNADYKSKGVQMLGVSYDNIGNPKEAGPIVRRFVKTNQIRYANVLGTRSIKEAIPQVKSLPSTVFVGPRGKVRLVLEGYHDYHVLETITDMLLEEAAIGRRANDEPSKAIQRNNPSNSNSQQRFRTSLVGDQ